MDWTAWLTDVRQTQAYERAALDGLSSYLQYECAAPEAASRIVAAERSAPFGKNLVVWNGLLSLGEHDAEVQQQVVDLIKAIDGLPGHDKPSHSLGIAWRDSYDSLWSEARDFQNVKQIDPLSPDTLISRWPIYHALTARLLAASLLDAHYMVLTHIVEALEVPLADPPTPLQLLNLAAAAHYFILAPREIYLNPLRSPASDDPGYGVKWGEDTVLWKAKRPGWSEERWAFWKARWAKARATDGVPDEVLELARRAEVGMDKVERAVVKKGEKKVLREGM